MLERHLAKRLSVRSSKRTSKAPGPSCHRGLRTIGLAALLTVKFCSPATIFMIHTDANRLVAAKKFGATTLINSADGTAAQQSDETDQRMRARGH
jgi:Zn-dependent alcohol dehydrogenase